MALASAQGFYTRIELLPVRGKNQIHFLLWLHLSMKFHQVVCGFLMTLPRKRGGKKISIHSGLQPVHTLAGGSCVGSLSGPRRSEFGLGFSREAFWSTLMNGCLCRPGSEAEEHVYIDWPFYLRCRHRISW